LGIWEALAALTRDAAYLADDEHPLDTLRSGSLADLVILDGDPAADADARIRSLSVRRVVVGGRFTREQRAWPAPWVDRRLR
jgi:predicted amidohydrolase YtcJ